jgi:hypothetical protein
VPADRFLTDPCAEAPTASFRPSSVLCGICALLPQPQPFGKRNLDVVYILQQLQEWVDLVKHHTMIHETTKEFLSGFRYDRRLLLSPQPRLSVPVSRQRSQLHGKLHEHAVANDGTEVPG